MKINKNLSREELRVKMCELQNEAQKYRQAIDQIDNKVNEKHYKSLLHKCFLCNNGYEWIRIEKYDKDYQLSGTIVWYSEESFDRIILNDNIWEDWLKEAKEISNEEFNNKLKEVVALIKYEI